MELSDSSGFVGLKILQEEATHQIVITPNMLRYQVHLNNNIKITINIYVKCFKNVLNDDAQSLLNCNEVNSLCFTMRVQCCSGSSFMLKFSYL